MVRSSDLMGEWAERVRLINSVPSGEGHPFRHDVAFPEKFGDES